MKAPPLRGLVNGFIPLKARFRVDQIGNEKCRLSMDCYGKIYWKITKKTTGFASKDQIALKVLDVLGFLGFL